MKCARCGWSEVNPTTKNHRLKLNTLMEMPKITEKTTLFYSVPIATL